MNNSAHPTMNTTVKAISKTNYKNINNNNNNNTNNNNNMKEHLNLSISAPLNRCNMNFEQIQKLNNSNFRINVLQSGDSIINHYNN